MKKISFLCLILTFLMLCGCSDYHGKENANPTVSKVVSSVTTNTLNDYFYTDDVVLLRADAKYSFEDLPSYETKKISAKMYKVKTYNDGAVFRLSVDPVGSLTAERLNIYFYVTKDKIYRLWSYFFNGDKVITFYDNDRLLVSTFDTDEKLIKNGEVVCQLENMSVEDDSTNKDYSVIKEGDKITYSSVELAANGDPYFSECFVWELHKGLIEYESSYNAESDLLKLTNISKTSNKSQ